MFYICPNPERKSFPWLLWVVGTDPNRARALRTVVATGITFVSHTSIAGFRNGLVAICDEAAEGPFPPVKNASDLEVHFEIGSKPGEEPRVTVTSRRFFSRREFEREIDGCERALFHPDRTVWLVAE
jgi:hypothetical protein